MIEAEGLSKFYGSRCALDGLSFEVAKGEIVGLLGPNGAGKSTVMNILTGFLSLSEGNVRINGCDIFEQARQARASVGYLPEQPPLYPELTVCEYLRHVCGLKKLERKSWSAELERVLDLCSLGEVSSRKIAYLSKGFCQRVGLAQALLGSPPLLVLDEPTVGLDPQQILEIRSLLRKLSGAHTILLSSHILSEIELICERVLILSEGHLIANEKTAHLRERLESAQLEIEFLADRRDAHAVLAGILQKLGIVEFSLQSRDFEQNQGWEQNLYRLELTLESATSGERLLFRFRLSQALNREGFTVVAMRLHQRSLEDIFLSLTHKDLPKENLRRESLPVDEDSAL